MSDGVRVVYEKARAVADALVEFVEPFCERVEIAGSLRRQRPDVGDIELVAVPRLMEVPDGLFTTTLASELDRAIDELVADGLLTRLSGGERYQKLHHVSSGLQVDLFIVRPPAQWGVIYLIRTGPADYSHRFVETMKPRHHVKDGALHRGSGFGCPNSCEVVPTPDEADLFAAIGRPFLSAELRFG